MTGPRKRRPTATVYFKDGPFTGLAVVYCPESDDHQVVLLDPEGFPSWTIEDLISEGLPIPE